MQIPFRAISKFTAKTIVGAAAYAGIQTTITNHTDLTEDDITVKVAAGVGGYIVQETCEKHTDALVDFTADKLVAVRNRKTTKTTETL